MERMQSSIFFCTSRISLSSIISFFLLFLPAIYCFNPKIAEHLHRAVIQAANRLRTAFLDVKALGLPRPTDFHVVQHDRFRLIPVRTQFYGVFAPLLHHRKGGVPLPALFLCADR